MLSHILLVVRGTFKKLKNYYWLSREIENRIFYGTIMHILFKYLIKQR